MSTATAALKSTAIRIPIGEGIWLDADVTTPPDATGVVLFAHGSGSSRHSPRNRYVATELNFLRRATVLADLLTAEEEQVDDRSGALRFDIPLLTRRVEHLIDWVRTYNLISTLPVGLFGASTGAAAALDAAATRPDVVRAVVSRGGRPDLATRLPLVQSPTLLIVGGRDTEVIQMNRVALRKLTCPRELQIVPAATHLFEESGALESVASAAGAWFEKYLRDRSE
jgi:putative phosphoribosyl transferase